ncbi:glycosyltransferase family 4 protein [Hazenella sp. IB182357]|uniref:Glycosyltransferase family 4 protein n=1 Tax=Polycladospora coralii TaxID=2771432 RepID=A0A926NBR0_9BACL|nr:glycosyltransferase family 4 protein [Polycladospora coralii]
MRNQLYCNADLCVFPSLYEPFGMVALEAMSHKVPVVVAETGGLKEIVQHRKTGMLFKKGSAINLAEQVNTVLSNLVLTRKMAEDAYLMLSKRYSWASVANQTKDIYPK